jgi:acid phosphatase
VSKVLVVVEENHSYEEMRGEMPYLARLSDQYGYATHWRAITHPSEPNYLAIAGGSTFGIADDDPPSSHHGQIGSARSVFDQALAAGRTAGVYAEGMPEPCHPVDYPSQAPLYAVRHNPWVYFEAGRAGCRAHDLALSAFAGDVAADRLPDVCFLIPDLEHDGHSASLAAADTWLKGRLEPVLRSDDFASGRLLVVVTADEDDGHSGNIVLTSVLDRRLSGVVVDTPLNHYSLTRYIDEVLGVSPLRDATDAPDMKAAFHL